MYVSILLICMYPLIHNIDCLKVQHVNFKYFTIENESPVTKMKIHG